MATYQYSYLKDHWFRGEKIFAARDDKEALKKAKIMKTEIYKHAGSLREEMLDCGRVSEGKFISERFVTHL